MIRSVQTLLRGIVDFTGMYPPLQLPLEEALRNFAAYRLGDHSWMLSHFTCPAAKLCDMDEYSALLFVEGQPIWRFSVTGETGEDMESFLRNFQSMLEGISSFLKRHSNSVAVEVFEILLPTAVVASGQAEVRELVERAAETLATFGLSNTKPFYEIRTNLGVEALAGALTALNKFNAEWAEEERFHAVGALMRAGGSDGESLPSSKELAFFIAGCSRLELCVKATGGLSQALSCRSETTDSRIFGFLNLFVALTLSYSSRINLKQIIQVLETESIKEFEFSDSGLRWRDQQVSVEQIEETRQLVVSFGSEQFKESVTSLERFGLLELPESR